MPRTWFSQQPPAVRTKTVVAVLAVTVLLFGFALQNWIGALGAAVAGLATWGVFELVRRRRGDPERPPDGGAGGAVRPRG